MPSEQPRLIRRSISDAKEVTFYRTSNARIGIGKHEDTPLKLGIGIQGASVAYGSTEHALKYSEKRRILEANKAIRTGPV